MTCLHAKEERPYVRHLAKNGEVPTTHFLGRANVWCLLLYMMTCLPVK
jgi:hypothetical protein